MMKKFSYRLTPELYRKIMFSACRKQYKTLITIVGIVLLLIAGVSYLGYQRTGDYQVIKAWLPLFIMLSLWIILLLYIAPVLVSKNKLNLKQYQYTRFELQDNFLVFSLEDGLFEKIPYSHFARTLFTDQYAILWKNAVDVVLIPVEAFEKNEDYQDVVSLLKDNIAKNIHE